MPNYSSLVIFGFHFCFAISMKFCNSYCEYTFLWVSFFTERPQDQYFPSRSQSPSSRRGASPARYGEGQPPSQPYARLVSQPEMQSFFCAVLTTCTCNCLLFDQSFGSTLNMFSSLTPRVVCYCSINFRLGVIIYSGRVFHQFVIATDHSHLGER